MTDGFWLSRAHSTMLTPALKKHGMTEEELHQLPLQTWMASRIPVRDALAAFIPTGKQLTEEVIPASYEQRWYPERDGIRLLIPYDGAAFDGNIFHLESGAWDHTTCVHCNKRIPAMALCYLTKYGPYIGLCSNCYKEHVGAKVGIFRFVLWRLRTWLGLFAAA